MAMSKRGTPGANALGEGRTLESRSEVTTGAAPDAVYDVLSDLSTHLEWGGRKQGKKTRLLTLDAPATAAVGVEFSTTGADPMGSFSDRSVVTEASRPAVLEFVTEATLTPKRGGEPIEWTIVHRYEIARRGTRTSIAYTSRIVRISRLPGILGLLKTRFAPIVMRMSSGIARRGLKNLAALAEGARA